MLFVLLMLLLYQERAFTKYRVIFYVCRVVFNTTWVTRKIDTLEVGLLFLRPADTRCDVDVNDSNLKATATEKGVDFKQCLVVIMLNKLMRFCFLSDELMQNLHVHYIR